MKKIRVNVKVINSLKEENNTVTNGEWDSEAKMVSYLDDGVLVNVTLGDKIIINRSHPTYKIELVFEEGKKNLSKYEINSPKVDIEIETNTTILRKNKQGFYIEYILKLNDVDMGLFSIDFKWEE
ncbi:MAG: DUF1934 family protein [Bacilli bacterium]|jgi:uncharacterized beta-barrel protein YwiB (DUF1934 family)